MATTTGVYRKFDRCFSVPRVTLSKGRLFLGPKASSPGSFPLVVRVIVLDIGRRCGVGVRKVIKGGTDVQDVPFI